VTGPAVSSVTSRKALWALFVLSLVAFTYLFLVSAWVVDEAYITFRTTDNFLSGHGLTWNPGERVQAYTHPLWMLLVSFFVFFTKEYFLTSLTVSFLASVSALGVAFIALKKEAPWKPFVFFFLFLTSKAIIDYSSSGLENPLTYLFVILFYSLYLNRDRSARGLDETDTLWLLLIAALSYLNRQDTVLLYLPALAAVLWERRKAPGLRLARTIPVGLSPAIAWLLFSTFYYGFPFPNTAYAKMITTNLSLVQRLERGSVYYLITFRWDALAFLAILVSFFYAVRSRQWKAVAGLLGIGIYLTYVWATASAATHMAGRFFAVPFVLAFFISARLLSSKDVARTVVAMGLAYTIVNPVSPWKLETSWYQTLPRSLNGYIDTLWFAHREGAALVTRKRGVVLPFDVCLQEGRQLRVSRELLQVGGCGRGDLIGYFGFGAGPDKWVVDRLALPDPLLARLQPCVDFRGDGWRPGHFPRELPEGYVESIQSKENRLRDPGLHEYYSMLRDVVSGPLWSLKRIKSIVLVNLGAYDRLLQPYNQAVAARARAGQCRF
jgi:arabinofuranosyltransferase